MVSNASIKILGEKQITKVTFTFEDGSEKVLEGRELVNWQVICLNQSDYLLPGNTNHILAMGYNGIVQGFIPPHVLYSPKQNWKLLE